MPTRKFQAHMGSLMSSIKVQRKKYETYKTCSKNKEVENTPQLMRQVLPLDQTQKHHKTISE